LLSIRKSEGITGRWILSEVMDAREMSKAKSLFVVTAESGEIGTPLIAFLAGAAARVNGVGDRNGVSNVV
jgi:hypothetical protein